MSETPSYSEAPGVIRSLPAVFGRACAQLPFKLLDKGMWAELKDNFQVMSLKKKKLFSPLLLLSLPPGWERGQLKWHWSDLLDPQVDAMYRWWQCQHSCLSTQWRCGAVQLVLCTVYLPISVLLPKRETEACLVKADVFGVFLYKWLSHLPN